MLWQHQNNIVLFKPILQLQKFSIYFLLPQIRNCFIKILRMFDMVNRIRKINGLIAGVEMRVGWSSSAHHHLFQYTTDTVITYNNYEHTLHSLLHFKLFTYSSIGQAFYNRVFILLFISPCLPKSLRSVYRILTKLQNFQMWSFNQIIRQYSAI